MKQQSVLPTFHKKIDHRWGIILAGGDGTRLQHFIKARFGEYRPKQYCALIGKRSMLRHTIDRITPLFPCEQLLVTINASHHIWAEKDLRDRSSKTIIVQPYNRETGPGILLSILHAHHSDPDATIALFPADHFILQEERYRSFVLRGMEFVQKHHENIVMLGITPSSLQYGYGWIEKGDRIFSDEFASVKKFWEKPDARLMQYLYEKKCLWNTMTLIGTSQNFLELFRQHMNEVFMSTQQIIKFLGTPQESEITENVFKNISPSNFSRAILEKITEKLVVLQMSSVYWNDWGDEMRVREDIDILEHHDQMGYNGGMNFH